MPEGLSMQLLPVTENALQSHEPNIVGAFVGFLLGGCVGESVGETVGVLLGILDGAVVQGPVVSQISARPS